MDYRENHVDYFHCLACRHIWNVPKGREGPVKHVTPRPPDRPPKMAATRDGDAGLLARADRAMRARRALGADYRTVEARASELAFHARSTMDDIAQIWRQIVDRSPFSTSTRTTRDVRVETGGTAVAAGAWRQRTLSAA